MAWPQGLEGDELSFPPGGEVYLAPWAQGPPAKEENLAAQGLQYGPGRQTLLLVFWRRQGDGAEGERQLRAPAGGRARGSRLMSPSLVVTTPGAAATGPRCDPGSATVSRWTWGSFTLIGSVSLC